MTVRALPVHRMGGLELHTHDLAGALAARGHTVCLVTSAKPTEVQNDAPLVPKDVQVAFLPIGKPGDYSAAFFAGIGSYTGRICRRIGGVDVLHTQEFSGLFMQHPDPKTARVWLNTVHGTMFTETGLDRRYSRLAGWGEWASLLGRGAPRLALHPVFKKSLVRPDRLVTDSEFTRNELIRLNPKLTNKIRVVPLGINLERYDVPDEGLPPSVSVVGDSSGYEPLTLALLGRVQDLKGVPDALEAVRILRDRGVFVRLRIGGTGEGLEPAKRFVDQHGLNSSVEFLGRVAPGHTSDFLRSADILLFPDRTQPAFGLVAVEAMAHGLPVIGTRCGAIPETVDEQENGWLIDPRAPQQLADLLTRLASSEAGRAEIGQMAMGAYRRLRYFKANRMAADMERVYAETDSGNVY